MALPTDLAATNIAVDHEWAQTYTLSYLSDLQSELVAQANILNLSMNAFNKFLEMPEADNRAGPIWDIAFTVLSTAVPALGLVKFVDKMHKASSVAVQIATSAGLKSGRAEVVQLAAKALQEGAKWANRVNDVKEAAGDVSEAYEKLTSEPEGELFEGLDPARKVIYELIDTARKATAAFKGAVAAETLEYTMRIYGITKPAGSLQDYIKNLLPPIPLMTRAELQEIEKLYLWNMIGHYCKSKVKMYRTTTTVRRHTALSGGESANTSIRADGLKESQQAWILKEFGPTSKRGKWFTGPHLHPKRPWDIYLFLAWHQVPVITKTYSAVSFAPSSKM
jgi:hypothetical protein